MSGQYALFAMGNPLLDIQVQNGEEVLKKYDLKANDAILVEAKHESIFDHVREKYGDSIAYVAGGAAQNAARAAAYCLPPNSAVYVGSVGDDDLADQLRAQNEKEGLKEIYQVQPKGSEPTGACAVILTGHSRSLVTRLSAAEKFQSDHLDKPEVKERIEGASHYYMEGFFLTHGLESALKLAKQAVAAKKTFAMNLSAPFIAQFFSSQVDQIMPYVSILIGNEDEAAAYAGTHSLDGKDLKSVALHIAQQPREDASKPRIVVITHGAEETILATSEAKEAKVYPVQALESALIRDTNGAGDAFAGAFLAALISGKDLDAAVEAGHKLGQRCVQQLGPTFGEKIEIL